MDRNENDKAAEKVLDGSSVPLASVGTHTTHHLKSTALAALAFQHSQRQTDNSSNDTVIWPFTITVIIHSGTNLPIADITTSDPFVTINVGEKQVGRTKTVYRNLNPTWEESFSCGLTHNNDILYLRVYDEDSNKSDFLGLVQFDISTLSLFDTQEFKFPLMQANNVDVTKGKLSFSLCLERNDRVIRILPKKEWLKEEQGNESSSTDMTISSTLSSKISSSSRLLLTEELNRAQIPDNHPLKRTFLLGNHMVNLMHPYFCSRFLLRDLIEDASLLGKFITSSPPSPSNLLTEADLWKLSPLTPSNATNCSLSKGTFVKVPPFLVENDDHCILRLLTNTESISLTFVNKFIAWKWVMWLQLARNYWHKLLNNEDLPHWASDGRFASNVVSVITSKKNVTGGRISLSMKEKFELFYEVDKTMAMKLDLKTLRSVVVSVDSAPYFSRILRIDFISVNHIRDNQALNQVIVTSPASCLEYQCSFTNSTNLTGEAVVVGLGDAGDPSAFTTSAMSKGIQMFLRKQHPSTMARNTVAHAFIPFSRLLPPLAPDENNYNFNEKGPIVNASIPLYQASDSHYNIKLLQVNGLHFEGAPSGRTLFAKVKLVTWRGKSLKNHNTSVSSPHVPLSANASWQDCSFSLVPLHSAKWIRIEFCEGSESVSVSREKILGTAFVPLESIHSESLITSIPIVHCHDDKSAAANITHISDHGLGTVSVQVQWILSPTCVKEAEVKVNAYVEEISPYSSFFPAEGMLSGDLEGVKEPEKFLVSPRFTGLLVFVPARTAATPTTVPTNHPIPDTSASESKLPHEDSQSLTSNIPDVSPPAPSTATKKGKGGFFGCCGSVNDVTDDAHSSQKPSEIPTPISKTSATEVETTTKKQERRSSSSTAFIRSTLAAHTPTKQTPQSPRMQCWSRNNDSVVECCKERQEMSSPTFEIPWGSIIDVDIVTGSILSIVIELNRFFGEDSSGKEIYRKVEIQIFLTRCPAATLCDLIKGDRIAFESDRKLILDLQLNGNPTKTNQENQDDPFDNEYSLGAKVIQDIETDVKFLESILQQQHDSKKDDQDNSSNNASTWVTHLSADELALKGSLIRRICRLRVYISVILGMSINLKGSRDYSKEDMESLLLWDLNNTELFAKEDEVSTCCNQLDYLFDRAEMRLRDMTLTGWYNQQSLGGSLERSLEIIVGGYLVAMTAKLGKFFHGRSMQQLSGLSSKTLLIKTFIAQDSKLAVLLTDLLNLYGLESVPLPKLSLFLDVNSLMAWYSSILRTEMVAKVEEVVNLWRDPKHTTEDGQNKYTYKLPWFPERGDFSLPSDNIEPDKRMTFRTLLPENVIQYLLTYLSVARIEEDQITESFKKSMSKLDQQVVVSFANAMFHLSTIYQETLMSKNWLACTPKEGNVTNLEDEEAAEIDEHLEWLCSVCNDVTSVWKQKMIAAADTNKSEKRSDKIRDSEHTPSKRASIRDQLLGATDASKMVQKGYSSFRYVCIIAADVIACIVFSRLSGAGLLENEYNFYDQMRSRMSLPISFGGGRVEGGGDDGSILGSNASSKSPTQRYAFLDDSFTACALDMKELLKSIEYGYLEPSCYSLVVEISCAKLLTLLIYLIKEASKNLTMSHSHWKHDGPEVQQLSKDIETIKKVYADLLGEKNQKDDAASSAPDVGLLSVLSLPTFESAVKMIESGIKILKCDNSIDYTESNQALDDMKENVGFHEVKLALLDTHSLAIEYPHTAMSLAAFAECCLNIRERKPKNVIGGIGASQVSDRTTGAKSVNASTRSSFYSYFHSSEKPRSGPPSRSPSPPPNIPEAQQDIQVAAVVALESNSPLAEHVVETSNPSKRGSFMSYFTTSSSASATKPTPPNSRPNSRPPSRPSTPPLPPPPSAHEEMVIVLHAIVEEIRNSYRPDSNQQISDSKSSRRLEIVFLDPISRIFSPYPPVTHCYHPEHKLYQVSSAPPLPNLPRLPAHKLTLKSLMQYSFPVSASQNSCQEASIDSSITFFEKSPQMDSSLASPSSSSSASIPSSSSAASAISTTTASLWFGGSTVAPKSTPNPPGTLQRTLSRRAQFESRGDSPGMRFNFSNEMELSNDVIFVSRLRVSNLINVHYTRPRCYLQVSLGNDVRTTAAKAGNSDLSWCDEDVMCFTTDICLMEKAELVCSLYYKRPLLGDELVGLARCQLNSLELKGINDSEGFPIDFSPSARALAAAERARNEGRETPMVHLNISIERAGSGASP